MSENQRPEAWSRSDESFSGERDEQAVGEALISVCRIHSVLIQGSGFGKSLGSRKTVHKGTEL